MRERKKDYKERKIQMHRYSINILLLIRLHLQEYRQREIDRQSRRDKEFEEVRKDSYIHLCFICSLPFLSDYDQQ